MRSPSLVTACIERAARADGARECASVVLGLPADCACHGAECAYKLQEKMAALLLAAAKLDPVRSVHQ